MKQKTSRKNLVRTLDKVVSDYIRTRDGRCVVCGTTENLTNGHLFSRVAYSTRWEELNCHAQCYGCNLRHEHDFYPYQNYFVKRYGQKAYEDLHFRYRQTSKFSNVQLQHMIDAWTKKLNSLTY